MLYPSRHNPFLHTPTTTFSFPVSPQKMEALKLESETAVFGEEFGGSNVDDLFVDEFLDFSNGFSEVEEPEETQPEKKTPTTFSNSVSQDTKPVVVLSEEANAITGQKDAFGPDSQITLPAEEELENLEWLSHFVEDSFSDFSLTGKLQVEPAAKQPCFVTPVQTKARTKRARTGVRVWPVLSPESSTSSGSATSSFPQSTLWVGSEPLFGKSVMKRRKKAAEGGGNKVAQPRRCRHCGVTKTPQWRAGPLGSKTLCNACGVRFKSGRLLPEYRPACSPTFSNELHSNNHRKVLEMRRKKETGLDGGEPVPSF